MTIPVKERVSFDYDFTLVKRDGTPVTLAELTSITMTLYDRETNTVINSRTAVDVVNTNGGTFHATSGAGSFRFTSLDNVIVTDTRSFETHVALFEATWDDDGFLPWEAFIVVENLHRLGA